MPSENKPRSIIDQFEDLREMLPDLEDLGATHDDLDLLNEVLGDPEYQALGELMDIFSQEMPEPRNEHASETYHDALEVVSAQASSFKYAKELKKLLENPHMRALFYTHDDVAKKIYDEVFMDALEMNTPPPPVFDAVGEQHRFVTITKAEKQPLGITVRLDQDNDLVIARILQDSLADKQGLLRVGDIVKEVNGVKVYVPEDLMIVLKEAEKSITIKIVPSHLDQTYSEPVYMKACFTYDPAADRLIPCKKAGLPFREGDVLDVVDNTDENWWQARLADLPHAPVGLIPSRTLQEKRNAFVQPQLTKTKSSLLCGLKVKRKQKIGYNSSETAEFDQCDIKTYEEVEIAKTHRTTLLLVGAHGVGKRSLKERLIQDFPQKYSAATPHTSRPRKESEQDGRGYFYVDGDVMEKEFKKNLYIDQGEYDGFLYGTKLSTVKDVIRTGKVCVLDIAPKSLKFLQTPEFKPFVVFIAAPSIEALKVMRRRGRKFNNNDKRDGEPSDLFMEERFIRTVRESREIERNFKGRFDEVIVNDDFENTYATLCEMLREQDKAHKWVPIEWNESDDR